MAKVLNIKTGTMENCTVGAGCQRHAHNLKSQNMDSILEVARSIENNVTEIEKEFHSGNDFDGLLAPMPVKSWKTGETEEIIVVQSRLGGPIIGLDEGDSTFVEVDSHEARFMDRDKLTAALGYALFKDGFTAKSNIMIGYELYGTSGDSKVYKVNRFTY